jgi:hypothetical protein
VFGHSRRRPRLALAMVLLSAGLVIMAFGIWDLIATLGDGAGVEYDPSRFDWIGPVIVGSLVITATALVSVVRQSTLRNEAQQVAVAIETSTESDPSDRELAGGGRLRSATSRL